MDILRRNTDYALRLMVCLAREYGGGATATRAAAQAEGVSYQLACKLMQRLHGAKLVESCMGPKGGFRLSRPPERIAIAEVIEAIQGPLRLNRCLLSDAACPRQDTCPIRAKIGALQDRMDEYLSGVSLAELVRNRSGDMERSGEKSTGKKR